MINVWASEIHWLHLKGCFSWPPRPSKYRTCLPVFWSFETYNGHRSDSTDNGNTADWNIKLLFEVNFHRYFSFITWRFDILYEPCLMHVFLYENTANYDVLLCFKLSKNDFPSCNNISWYSLYFFLIESSMFFLSFKGIGGSHIPFCKYISVILSFIMSTLFIL